jgi:hypothetical protein
MVMHPHTKYHWPISKVKHFMERTKKCYLKNNYLTLRSNDKVQCMTIRRCVAYCNDLFGTLTSRSNNFFLNSIFFKVQRRSLRYAIHRLMVMHPHTKYHWPISKETIIWPWGQSPMKVITVRDTPPYGHAPTYQISLVVCHIP